ncbi:hypothetical protein GGI15_004300 [Coemansia interrupta]|uniref:Uncharacterized protein n=1 Tax=Coemansia interrupta TaxID=1126814 RepID=A0A9W8HB46_9FUNG|nr:hypothetical protein GGI15_004300 [Coemansia interrupta]
MSRQGARLPAFHKGNTGRDDRGGSSTAETNGGSRSSSRGRGGSGRGGASRKAIFQPSVRALPLGSSPQALVEQLPRDRKSRGSGHQSLLLVNKRASSTAADTGQKTEVAASAADAAVADVVPTIVNPWAARLKERAGVADSTDSQDAPLQTATATASVEVMPMPELGSGGEDVGRWDEMVDSGIDFLKSELPAKSQTGTATDGRSVEKSKSECSAGDAPASEMRIPSNETATIIDAKVEDDKTESEPDMQGISAEVLHPQPASASTLAAIPAPPPKAVAEKWGKPTKAPTEDSQPTQAQASRWWKASLSGGTRTTPTPPPQLSDSQTRRQGPLKLGAMQKSDSDSASKGRTAKPGADTADGKAKRGGARRQTAPVPTVVPPMVLSKAMGRSREYSPSLLPETASELQPVPDTTSIEEQAAIDTVVVTEAVKPEISASTKSKTEVKVATPLSSKPSTPLEKKLASASGSDNQQTDSWRTGPRPKPQSQPQTQPQSQSPLSQSPADSAAGTRRRNTIAPRGAMRLPSTPQDRADRSRKASSTASWRAAPKTEDGNASVRATTSQPNSASSKGDSAANSKQMPRVDRQRAQTQSASISGGKAGHGLYYNSVPPGALRSGGSGEQNKLDDLLQIQSSSHMAKSGVPAVVSSGSMDQPLLSQKILADILGDDGISAHRGDAFRKSIDANTSSNHPKPVKPIGAPSKGMPAASVSVPITSATAASVSGGVNDVHGGRNQSAALEQSSLALSSSSLFQLNEKPLLVSPYSGVSTHPVVGASSTSISAAAAAAVSTSASESKPFSWQHAHSEPRADDPRGHHGYFHPASSASAPGLHEASTYHQYLQYGSTAPVYNVAPPMVAEQQWMYAPAMSNQAALYPLYDGNVECVSSGATSGPSLGAFESGATMLWTNPGQYSLDSSGNRSFRSHTDNSHTQSRGEANSGSGQQRGFKGSGRAPRPIGTRNTPTDGSRNVRSRQGNDNAHIQQQQQQPWFPQYAGIQPQIYMHSPVPGYAVSSPHDSPHMSTVPAAGGSTGMSPYMVPFSHMTEAGNPHQHAILAMQQAPVVPLPSTGQNYPHAHPHSHSGHSGENADGPAYMGTLPPQYFSNHAHPSPPQLYTYAYAGPPVGSQHHFSQQQQQQQQQQHQSPQAYSPYMTVPSYGADPAHVGYAPMYMGQVDAGQCVPGGPYYYTATDPQSSEQQQQQHYRHSPLSLSAAPFQPGMPMNQESLDLQPQTQQSQRPRSKGLELIQRSASNSDGNTVTGTSNKDVQSEAAVPAMSTGGNVPSKALQADPKPKSRSDTPQSNPAKESRGRGRRSQDRRSQDRRNPKLQPATTSASASATAISIKPVAVGSEPAQPQPKSENKRRPRADRAKKPAKPAAAEVAQEPAEQQQQQQQSGRRGRGGNGRSGRGAKRTDKAALKA